MTQTFDSNYSDEVLNAYIDGELNHDENLQLMQAAQQNTELAARLQQLRQAKEGLKLAYQATHVDTPLKASPLSMRQLAGMAAVMVMVTGISLGWLGHAIFSENTSASLAAKPQGNTGVTTKPWRVVMHINSTDSYLQNTLLMETEDLLQSFKDDPQAVQVEIVAYGPGVLMFDTTKSKFTKRLDSLKQRFGNLNYAVCGRSVEKIEKEKHVSMHLLPDITITRSGLHQIIKRQQEGWNYIRL